MGARPSSFTTGGGGFLNNVDGVIVSMEFTDEQPGDGTKKKGKKNDDFTALQCRLTAQADGADEPVSTSLYTGLNAQDIEISEDGKSITRNDGEDINIPRGKALGIFMASMAAQGFDESALPEDGEPVSYEACEGYRVRFVQEVDEEGTRKRGKRKGKDGKEYNRQNLVVSEVYGQEEAPAAKTTKGKTAAKAAPVAAKGKKVAAPVEDDFTEEATETLNAILSANDGEINRSKLGTPALRILLKNKSANKDEVLALMKSEDFLNGVDGVSFNKKTGTITAD